MNDELATLPPTNEVQKATHSACRMLAIREHSKKQLFQKLLQKGFSRSSIEKTLNNLLAQDWLSEERFCSVYIRSKAAKGQGLIRIENALRQLEIPSWLIMSAVAEESINWQQICERALQKKITTMLNGKPIQAVPNRNIATSVNLQQKVKLESFLSYRGFSSEQIKLAFNRYLVSSPILKIGKS